MPPPVQPIPTRLMWWRTFGVARHDGVETSLRAPPSLPGVQFHEIDFAPNYVAILRPTPGDAARDMTADEMHAATQLLHAMAAAARAVLDHHQSITDHPSTGDA